MLKLTVKEAEGGLVLLMQAQAMVPEGVPWAVVVPDRTGIVMPWHKSEEEELFDAVDEALPPGATSLSPDKWEALARSLRTPRVVEELEEHWTRYNKGEVGRTGDVRPPLCLVFVPLSNGASWPLSVQILGALSTPAASYASTGTSPTQTPLGAALPPSEFQRTPSGDFKRTTSNASVDSLSGLRPSESEAESDIELSFTPNVHLLPGDVLDLFLPGFGSGPTFLGTVSTAPGNSRLVHTSYNDLAVPLASLVPKAWEVDKSLKTARLRLEVQGFFDAHTRVSLRLSRLFGCPPSAAGILFPSKAKRDERGFLKAAGGGGGGFNAMRPNAEDLSFAMELPRDVEAGDEVVVKLPVGFTGSSTDSIGVCSIKTLAQQLLAPEGEREKPSTSSARWAKRWGPASYEVGGGPAAGGPGGGEVTFRARGHVPQRELVVLTLPRYQPALREEFLPLVWPRELTDNSLEGELRCNPWWPKAKLLLQLQDHSSSVNSLSVADHGTAGRDPQIFSADGAGAIVQWHVGAVKDSTAAEAADRWSLQVSRRKRLEVDALEGVAVVCIRVHAAGRLLAALAMDNHVRVFTTQPLEQKLRLGGVRCSVANACMKCSFSPDGRYLSAGSEDGKVWVWSMESGKPIRNVLPDPRYRSECSAVVWSPTERVVATCSIGRRSTVFLFAYDPHTAGGGTAAEDLVQEALQGKWSDLNETFAKLDTNGDGILDWSEFKQGLGEMETGLSEGDLLKAFNSMAACNLPQPGQEPHVRLEDLWRRLAPREWAELKTTQVQEAARAERAAARPKVQVDPDGLGPVKMASGLPVPVRTRRSARSRKQSKATAELMALLELPPRPRPAPDASGLRPDA